MNKLVKHILLILFTGLISVATYGQDNDPNWNVDGEIENAEFVIVKNKKLELPRANRFFRPIKVEKNGLTRSIGDFEIKTFGFAPEAKLPTIKVKKISKSKIEKLYGNKVTLGYGNFQSPFIDLSLANKRDKLYSYGFNFNHYSFGTGAVDGENSASGITDVSAFAKSFGKKATVYGSAGYNNEVNHFFGYHPTDTPPAQDDTRLTMNRFNVKAGIFGTDEKNPLRYKVESGFSGFSNNFDATENTFNVNGDLSYQLNDDERLQLDVAGNFSQYTDSTDQGRNLVTFTPAYRRKISGIYLTVGFQLALANDTLSTATNSSVFPQVNVRFPLSEDFDVYGGLTGGKSFNTLNGFTRENPWVGPGTALVNTSNKLEIYGGINGKIGERVSTNVSFSAGSLDNMAFFVNGAADSTRFDVIYDNTSLFKFSANLEYSFYEKASVHATASFFGYDTDVLAEAWHQPTFTLELGSKFNIYEKILLSPSVNVLAGIEGLNLQSGTRSSLDPVVLLNLQAKYILSGRAGIYANFNNLIGDNFQRYLNYPGRGLQVNVGLSYSF